MLFNRVVELTIGPEGGPGILIKGLRVTFKIKKSEPKTNPCTIEIYNLSESTRTIIIDLDDILILKAGYADDAGVVDIFAGNLTNISHGRKGADIITKLTADDGATVRRETVEKLTYSGVTSGKQVLKDLISKFPLATYFMDGTLKDANYEHGFAFSGPFATAMDKLAAKLGFSWSVQDNELQVLKTGKSNNDPAVVLSKDTGMIGIPERLQDKSKAKLVENQNKPGWRVQSLLMPKIKVGGQIRITSEAQSKQIPPNAPFRVTTVEHVGDTHGKEWTTTIECTEMW